MTARQLRIGRILLAATHCGQQTFNSIEGRGIRANGCAALVAARPKWGMALGVAPTAMPSMDAPGNADDPPPCNTRPAFPGAIFLALRAEHLS